MSHLSVGLVAVALWTAGCTDDPVSPPPPEELSAAAVPGIKIGTGQSSRFAYVWANQYTRAINSWYSPSTNYRYNGKGQLNRARRVGTGRYEVQFNGMAKGGTGTLRETLVATAYGNTDAHCTVTGWFDSGANLRSAIECTDSDGNYKNARFTLLLVGNGSLNERYAFAWANLPSSSGYVPSTSYSFTTGGPPITIVKEDVWEQVGHVIYDNDTIGYRVDLRVPRPFGGPAEAYLVTRYGSSDTMCRAYNYQQQVGQPQSLNFWGSKVEVRCFPRYAAGSSVQGRYNTLALTKGRSGKRMAFATIGPDTSQVGYVPQVRSAYSYSSVAGWMSVSQAASDEYTVTFAGLGRTQAGQTETVAVASLGAGFVPCGVRSWSNAGGNVTVRVQCRNPSGMLVNQSFVVLVIEG